MADAVVVGAGPNGLVAANVLADQGWSVVVVEEQPTPGGGVRSAELIERGFVNDCCSAFYPLAVASPVVAAMELDRYGLRWLRAPAAIAHPALDGTCPAIFSGDVARTAATLPSDEAAWAQLVREWRTVGDDAVGALLGSPFPPVVPAARLVARRNRPTLSELARLCVLPVRTLGEERFSTTVARRLLAGLALHADLSPEVPLSGCFGWLLAGLAQQHGFPVPAGGAQSLTDALANRLTARGGRVVCDTRIDRVVVERGAAVGVIAEDGSYFRAARAVLADVDAPQLYIRLLRGSAPDRVLARLRNFHWDNATFKVDWNLDGPIPWRAEEARLAGTIHIAESDDELTTSAAQLATGTIPAEPFLVMGQQSIADSSRQPEGKETAWAYTHVPQRVHGDAGEDGLSGRWDAAEAERFADRIQTRIERLAPGFCSLIRGRHITTPPAFTAENRSTRNGALNLGTAQMHQQVIFRPGIGWGRSETPIARLFLASASAHPGGGVHGACGSNAARAAILHDRLRRMRALVGRLTTRGPIERS